MNWRPGAFLEFATRVLVLPLCCELILGVPFELVQGNQALSQVDGELCVSQFVARQVETGLLLRCNEDVGIPFQTKQGNRPSFEMRSGKGAQIEVCRET